MSKKLLAAAVATVMLGSATPAFAETSSSSSSHLAPSFATSTKMSDENIIKWGVTTQEDVDKCNAENPGPFTVVTSADGLYFYDNICPRGPLTEEDVAAARQRMAFSKLVGAPIAFITNIMEAIAHFLDSILN